MAALFINASTAAWSFACKLGVTISQCHCHNVACKAETFSIYPNTCTDFPLILDWGPTTKYVKYSQAPTGALEFLRYYILIIHHHDSLTSSPILPRQLDIIIIITTTAWHHQHHHHDSLTHLPAERHCCPPPTPGSHCLPTAGQAWLSLSRQVNHIWTRIGASAHILNDMRAFENYWPFLYCSFIVYKQ